MGLLANEVAEVRHFGTADGQAVNNFLYWRIKAGQSVPAGGVPLTDIITGVLVGWDANFTNQLHSSFTRVRTEALAISGREPAKQPSRYLWKPTYREKAENIVTSWTPSTRTGEALPLYNALGIRKVTNRPGKGFRGSMRLSPFLEVDNTYNDWTSTFKTTMSSAIDWLKNELTIGGILIEPVVLSKSLMLTVVTPTIVPADYAARIVSVGINPYVSSQVSRKKRLRFL